MYLTRLIWWQGINRKTFFYNTKVPVSEASALLRRFFCQWCCFHVEPQVTLNKTFLMSFHSRQVRVVVCHHERQWVIRATKTIKVICNRSLPQKACPICSLNFYFELGTNNRWMIDFWCEENIRSYTNKICLASEDSFITTCEAQSSLPA